MVQLGVLVINITIASKLLSRRMLAALMSRWIILGWPARDHQYVSRKEEILVNTNKRAELLSHTIFMKISKSLG